MPSDVLMYGIVLMVGAIGTGVYMYMSKRSKVAAYHELGHGLVAAYYGAKVHSISIDALAAGGVTRFGDLLDDTKYPSVMVAGYVAEEILAGRYPSGRMNGAQYYHDRAMVLTETKNDVAKVDEAIKDAYRILTEPEIKASLEYMAPILVRNGMITIEMDH